MTHTLGHLLFALRIFHISRFRFRLSPLS